MRWRRAEKRAPLLSAEQHRLHVYGTLGFGLLTGAFKPGHAFDKGDWRNNSSTTFWLPLFQRDNFEREVRVGKRLAEVAARHGRSLAQLGIAWVLSNPAVTVALVGMRNDKFQRVLKDFDGKGLTRPRRLQQE